MQGVVKKWGNSAAVRIPAESQDWRVRKAVCQGQISAAELAEVRAKLLALIG